MLKKSSIIMLLFIVYVSTATAQRNELGVQVGAANYNGDLNPGPLNLKFLHPGFGVFYRFNKSKFVAYKLGVYYGWISGDDAKSKDSFQLQRNLSFFSHVLDFSGEIEFNFFPFVPGTPETYFTPYIFGGFTIFQFNPTANLGSTNYALEPLQTEGGGYGRVAAALPFGGGFKLSLTQVINIGYELGVRRTYTSHLDDVSGVYPDPSTLSSPAAVALSNRSNQPSEELIGKQRGNGNEDWYMFTGFWITFNVFKIGKHSCEAFPHFRY